MSKMTFSEKWNKLKKYPLVFKEEIIVDYPNNKEFKSVNIYTEDGTKFGCFNDSDGSTLTRCDVFSAWGGKLPNEVKIILQG